MDLHTSGVDIQAGPQGNGPGFRSCATNVFAAVPHCKESA